MDPYFFGAFGKGLQQTTGSLLDFMREREKIEEQKKESDLRSKMLDLQIKKEQRAQEDAQRQQMAVDELAQSYGQPQPFARPPNVEGPLMESGAFGQLPADPRMAAMLRAQPKEAVQGLLRQQMQKTSGGENLYPSIEAAQAALRNSGITGLIGQTPEGMYRILQTTNPVNPGAKIWHGVFAQELQAHGDPIRAQQAANIAQQQQNFGISAAQGAGSVGGRAGQELGEPVAPYVGIQGQHPMQPVQPPPLAQPATPRPAQGAYPSPAGGSQAQRALRQREVIQREEQHLGESTAQQMSSIETLLNATIPNIRRNFSDKYLGPVMGTDIAFEGRRRVGSAVGMPVTGGETVFRTALKDAGDQLLRARSGAQINEQEYARLRSILPQATDEPQVFRSALNRFEQELRILLQAKRRTSAQPRGAIGGRAGLPPPPPGWR